MRALMALVERDHHLVRTAELSAVAPEVLVAARRAGILRADDPGLEDISATIWRGPFACSTACRGEAVRCRPSSRPLRRRSAGWGPAAARGGAAVVVRMAVQHRRL